MVIYSCEGKHTVDGIGLALVAGAVLCLTPEIGEALSSQGVLDWRPRARRLARVIFCVALGGFVLIGLNLLGFASRLVGLGGVALVEVALVSLIPFWAGQTVTAMAKMTQEDETLSAWWSDFEARKGPALLGVLMFAIGTLIQLVAATR